MIEEFKRYQQQLITAIHDYETKREALRTSRSQVHEHKLKLLRIGDEFEVDGKNQTEREKDFRRQAELSQRYQAEDKFLQQEAELVAMYEGEVESLKYTIRLHELEMKFCIAQLEGVKHD